MSFLRSIRFWIGLIISVVCLWLAFRNVPLTQFFGALELVKPGYLAVAAGFQFLAVAARGVRWQSMLGGDVRFRTTFFGHGIGFLFNNILPFRAGEVARMIAVADWAQQPLFKVGSSVLLERLIDVAVVVLALLLVLPFMQVETTVLRAGLVLGGVALTGIILLFASAWRPSWGRKLVAWLVKRIPLIPQDRAMAWFDQLMDGVKVLTSARLIVRMLIWSIVSWIFSILLYFSVFRSFQPDANLVEATFVVVALSLSISIPSSPGFLGVFQYVGMQALVIPFGQKYDDATALAAVMVAYLVYYIGTSLIGVFGLQGFSGSLTAMQTRIANFARTAGRNAPGSSE
ncbi:MAG: lysylphosphatidylglycerol synthase transmembrane domain-containing protein [Anaerolineales bacterium]